MKKCTKNPYRDNFNKKTTDFIFNKWYIFLINGPMYYYILKFDYYNQENIPVFKTKDNKFISSNKFTSEYFNILGPFVTYKEAYKYLDRLQLEYLKSLGTGR